MGERSRELSDPFFFFFAVSLGPGDFLCFTRKSRLSVSRHMQVLRNFSERNYLKQPK